MPILCQIALAMCLAAWPSLTYARCEGAVVLATIHDAYLATIRETAAAQRQAAIALLFSVGEQDVDVLAAHVERSGHPISYPRLSKALTDGRELATHVLEASIVNIETFHTANTDWLAQIVDDTGCLQSKARATTPASKGETSPTYAGRTVSGYGNWKSFRQLDNRSMALVLLAASVSTAVVLFAGLKLWRSPFVRKLRMERLPRHPISLEFDLTFTTPDGENARSAVKAIDISPGGMKLDWSAPALPGTVLTLNLPIGVRAAQVAWANDYFAGVMLDTQLSSKDFQALQSGSQAEVSIPDRK